MRVAIAIVGVVLAISRAILPVIPIEMSPMCLYRDAMHIVVGVLIGGGIFAKGNRATFWAWVVVLSIVEVAVVNLKGH